MAQAQVVQTIKDSTTGRVICVVYDDDTFRIDWGRASYPHVDKAWSKPTTKNPNPTPAFSCSLLLPKKIYRPVKDVLVAHNLVIMKAKQIDFVKDDAKYLVDGDKTGKPEAAGCFIIRAREERKPFVKGVDNANLTESQAKSTIYPGAHISMLIRPWAQKSDDWGKRLNCNLIGVKALGGGEQIGEGGLDEDDVSERFADAEANGGFDDNEADDDDFGGL